ncbi:hypothetical protein LTR91_024699 [Friedmanniomyces endolithicus]|uniref:G-patch domain-containing protein n=1 Tax=Friedmanniomyces endolithicus TaxID=329885 RepID=A0AAN6JXB6_9PEZI|nr:hypothetical protein LTR94_006210 [Friedmanniomyces endolithicus]KAK0781241.1 hypothetical protein LTR38_013826 [Friedmanniomyces endolithicus]KAK0783523.1 hypothetical protein LTR75_014100 [Friedmanniomyces endolithicus]KAK0796390.1 hypothetical protein LTR59_007143 [Friedmanniomyces endolithicus]KAK0850429.1 hypothetical protein LTR03_004659 [Friedmanniomyces endolithicus]
MSSKRSRAAFETDHAPPAHAPYALYGTPLPAYDLDARDDGSYVPIWKQEVTDERGRKRLHGAFTGGFSAGYFNTVGSKEGWAPSTFVSSRANRAKDGKAQSQGQRVEEFMDEEDLAEQAESQKLETQGGFAGLGSGSGDGGGKGMFADLFRAEGETMGVKLLQRMGWRQGQGVGPRVKRRAQGDDKGEAHLFAPVNAPMITISRKTDHKGLGFAGEEKLENEALSTGRDDDDDDERDARILQSNRSKVLTKPKKVKTSSLGVGVLNDTGSDDEDPYVMGPQISYNRIIGGDKKKKKGGIMASNAVPAVSRPVFTSKKLTQRTATSAGFRKCHDGRLPLDGFVLSLAPLTITEENKHPPPEVPPGWQSTKTSTAGSTTTDPNSTPTFTSTADAAKLSTLNPTSRTALLGEQPLPGKSIFDYLSPATRAKLATATGHSNLPPARNERAPAGFEASEADSKRRTLWDLVPALDKETAGAALQRGKTGWMPYAEDEGKRERYRSFLELKAGLRADLPERAEGFGLEAWGREMGEFAQAAEVFKPISGLMATRFTSSASGAPRLASDAIEPAAAARVERGRSEDPAEKAAKMGMFGPLTRSKVPFYPTRLLCKRFNVRPPANVGADRDEGGGGGAEGGGAGNKRLEVVNQASLDRMMREANWEKRPVAGEGGFVSGGMEGGSGGDGGGEAGGKEEELARERLPAEVSVDTNEALEGRKAGEAVFRAIFGDSDEEE